MDDNNKPVKVVHLDNIRHLGGGMIAATLKGEALYEFPSDETKLDWEGLRERIRLSGGIRNTSILAKMPERDPPRVMDGTTPGIMPVREYMTNGKYDPKGIDRVHTGLFRRIKDPRISEEEFQRRLNLKTTYGALHSTLQAAVEGNAEARALLDQLAAPDRVVYDPVTGACCLESQVDTLEEIEKSVWKRAEADIKDLVETGHYAMRARQHPDGSITPLCYDLVSEDPIFHNPDSQYRSTLSNPESSFMFANRNVRHRTDMFNTSFMGTNTMSRMEQPVMLPYSTTTQSKRQKREAKKATKPGQNYLKIGKR